MKSGSTEPSLQESLLPCSDEVGLSNFHKCVMKSILCASFGIATFLMILPQVKVDGGLVPIFFRDRPRYYHMFVVSTVFALMGAYSALVIQHKHKPRVERFCRIYAIASMLVAIAIVFCAAAL